MMSTLKASAASADSSGSKKRKRAPQSSSSQNIAKRGGAVKRVKTLNSRSILTQTADSALNNGELDLQSFLKAREFEIKALQDGMERSKSNLSKRAFQQVPRDMRRRTASHNVKRVPKRMRNRASREMKDDNTPTVRANKRKPGSSRGRIRADTAKRLGILAEKRRYLKTKNSDGNINTRLARPKICRNKLNEPPKPLSKYRKRQLNKTWLPTHLWLSKRAKMTEPTVPLWRFAIPITSTEKSYRPTHRAISTRGAVAWDMSYMSSIRLEGSALSLETLLKSVGVEEQGLWSRKGQKWREGKRSWQGWLTRDFEEKRVHIGPSTIIWCPTTGNDIASDAAKQGKKPPRHQILVRIHPAAFLETWLELLRLSKMQRPAVHIEDLRFEIGSIDITGPGSTEALLGILHPYDESDNITNNHSETFRSLAGITNPSSLPSNTLLSFSVIDPRLRYPPKPVVLPKTADDQASLSLLEVLSLWPADASIGSSSLFDRNARFKASQLPSQKALNRRKALAIAGEYPKITEADPKIPVMLLTSRSVASPAAQGSWTLLAPWKCILPIWYGLMHYPLSSGGNPRFGGLNELRQIHFEHRAPWFPADFPGTAAGFNWEVNIRLERQMAWKKRPKGKRIEWESLDLGVGRKGEIGRGWASDFEMLTKPAIALSDETLADSSHDAGRTNGGEQNRSEQPVEHLPKKNFTALISSIHNAPLIPIPIVSTVLIELVSRGVANPCARIYRLPSGTVSQITNPNLGPHLSATRDDWLALLPAKSVSKLPTNPTSKVVKTLSRLPLDTPLPQRARLLAQSLLTGPPVPFPPECKGSEHPLVPDEEDLIGFVTTGEFNLAEGKGVAVGTVSVSKVLEGFKRDRKNESTLCIVRNAGEKVGRLARWKAI